MQEKLQSDQASTSQQFAGYVLGMDTCGGEATLALADVRDGQFVTVRERTLGARTAGTLLTGALRELMGEISVFALHAIVVVRGPGSFTGMRIGLSTAKALSEAAGVPIVAASRLAVLAQTAGTPLTALDAGRGNLYLHFPDANENVAEERLVTAVEAKALLDEEARRRLALCEDRVHEIFPEARRVPAPSARDALQYARARVLGGDWDDTAALDALYLWRAEQMLGKSAPAR